LLSARVAVLHLLRPRAISAKNAFQLDLPLVFALSCATATKNRENHADCKEAEAMSDLKLFQLGSQITELEGSSITLEKSLQTLIEKNLETFLGVRFLASEFSTGKNHGGRIDTLGLDENDCPVIIEYKRATNENVVNQGLFYLDWLMDHKRDFEWLVLEKFGREKCKEIEWPTPRLICIANDFTKYDEHAVKQINRNVELVRYRRYGDDLLLLDLVNATATQSNPIAYPQTSGPPSSGRGKTVSEYLAQADLELSDRYEAVKAFLLALGDDVQLNTLKNYFAFRRIKNFACVEVHTKTRNLLAYVKVDPSSIDIKPGFTRDVSNIGHFGTGELEITIRNLNDFENAKPLFVRSYEVS
jgi:predicted transport protein